MYIYNQRHFAAKLGLQQPQMGINDFTLGLNMRSSNTAFHGKANVREKMQLRLGQGFSGDANGKIYTDIHVNGGVQRPVLTAIVKSKGLPVAGEWVKIHDLDGGKPWRHMFENQCATPLHDLADNHPDLFETLMHVFSGSRVEAHMGGDIGVVIHVLPKVPVLICYRRAFKQSVFQLCGNPRSFVEIHVHHTTCEVDKDAKRFGKIFYNLAVGQLFVKRFSFGHGI